MIYVSSSDPRIGGGPSHTDTNLDTNSGVLSRIKRVGGQWDPARSRPRARALGGEPSHQRSRARRERERAVRRRGRQHQPGGRPSNNFALLPEYALSAAILEIDLGAIGETTYDLPTLDDETRPGTDDANDPVRGQQRPEPGSSGPERARAGLRARVPESVRRRADRGGLPVLDRQRLQLRLGCAARRRRYGELHQPAETSPVPRSATACT